MAELHLELHRRNARLRAWKAYGVPVEGGWEPGAAPTHGRLALRCAACDRGVDYFFAEAFRLRPVEFDALRALDCPHLAPLLGADPPEVQATTELEILAGV